MDNQTLLAEQMARVAKAFLKALEEFREEKFFSDLPSGGHSAAWHALHIADWVQILVPSGLENMNTDLKFGYLGWEEAEFAKGVYGLGEVNLHSSKADIIAHLKTHLERAAKDVQSAPAESLERSVLVPMGERKILPMLMTHIGHVPYHYGQLKINAKQL